MFFIIIMVLFVNFNKNVLANLNQLEQSSCHIIIHLRNKD